VRELEEQLERIRQAVEDEPNGIGLTKRRA
jgi:hypothetical protein